MANVGLSRYRVIDLLGQGTFGQVVKCERISTGELFSVKVIKNKSAYKTQSCMEIEILKKVCVCLITLRKDILAKVGACY